MIFIFMTVGDFNFQRFQSFIFSSPRSLRLGRLSDKMFFSARDLREWKRSMVFEICDQKWIMAGVFLSPIFSSFYFFSPFY